MKITAYLKTHCPWCTELKDFFIKNNIYFEEKDVTKNPEFFNEMIELSGQQKAPTIIIDGKVYADVGVDEVKKILINHKAEEDIPKNPIGFTIDND